MKRVIKDSKGYRDFMYPDYEMAFKPKSTVEEYLVEYNDYMRLYEMFGDEEYKIKAEKVMIALRKNFSELK
jgi:hypothetical protein